MDDLSINEVGVLLAQSQYVELMSKKYDFSNATEQQINDMLFPASWYTINDTDTKMRALAEAINNNMLLIETEAYNAYLKRL